MNLELEMNDQWFIGDFIKRFIKFSSLPNKRHLEDKYALIRLV